MTSGKSGRGNASENDTPAKGEGFDQAFASAAKADDGRSDNATHEGQSNGPQKSTTQNDVQSGSPQTPAPVAVNKQPGSMQAAAELLDTQAAVGETAGSPDKPAIAPLVSALAILAGRSEGGKQEKVPCTNEKKQEQSEKASGAPFTGLGTMPNGLPLDSASVAILLGGGAARPANPVAKAAIAATNGGSSPEKETPLISGVAPRPQVNVGASGADLAFALRLSRGAQPAPGTDAPAEAAGAGASVNAFVKELETAADKTAGEIKTRIGNESATDGAANIVETRTPAPAADEAAPAVTPVSKTEALELPNMSNAPVRAVRVELASDGNQRVALTLVERGGALSVSVHSADSHLARSLQEHLPDLSTRLSEQRYQTEVWTPRVEAPDAAGAGESAHHDSESGGGMQGGADRNPNPGQQQGRGNREAPAWFEELAAIGRRPSTRSEYLWVQ